MAKFKPNAETHRIKALGHFLSKDLEQARLEIDKALEQDPDQKVIREMVAMINYFSVLSPVVLSYHLLQWDRLFQWDRLVQWPEPVGRPFIKRDDDSLIRLREAATIFKKLSEETEEGKEKKTLQCWHLACLATDPDKQEEAKDYCRKLLQYDPTDFWAIRWATTQSYGLDLEPSEKALSSKIQKENPDILYVMAFVICKLALQKITEAVEVFENIRPKFDSEKKIRDWTALQAQSLIANHDPQAALIVIDQSGIKENLYYDKMLALQAIAQKTDDWEPLVEFLENAKDSGDTSFLFYYCNLMAERDNWEYVAQRSQQLIDEIGTPEALKLAAIACHNHEQFDICLRLLDGHRDIFEGSVLPNDLIRLRVSCLNMLGAFPKAIKEMEALINEEPSAENFLILMDLYSKTGDLKKLAILARQYKELPDLTQPHLLRTAYLIKWEDSDLAVSFWKKAVSEDVPDDLIGGVVTLGFQLGLDENLKPFLSKMWELGGSGQGGVTVLNLKDMISFAKQRREHLKRIADVYDQGVLPIHVIAEELDWSLLDLFHYRLNKNEEASNPRNQFYLFARHGGRQIPDGFPDERPQWRLNLDITAILLAAHLDILSKVEDTFAPLRIPENLVISLVKMKDKLTHHQPSRLKIANQIIDIENEGLLNTWEYEPCPRQIAIAKLIEEMGERWVTVFARALKEKMGCIALFSSIEDTQDMS